jgi:hypothetical protein
MEHDELLTRCSAQLGGSLDESERAALLGWHEQLEPTAAPSTEHLMSAAPERWSEVILAHRAHTHRWYDHLANEIDLDGFAVFLLENRYFPAFIPMLRRILEVQASEQGRRAVQENIDDEHEPRPHAELMHRLMEAVRRRASPQLELKTYPSLVDRTLVFYHGYFNEPWHLVGSLFATEMMGVHRVTHMGIGLRRLGLDEADLEFVRIHSECDEEHARQWREDVILPAVAEDPARRPVIAAGIAECLETSARYLDDLLARQLGGVVPAESMN